MKSEVENAFTQPLDYTSNQYFVKYCSAYCLLHSCLSWLHTELICLSSPGTPDLPLGDL
uniref:Uncharacterized protein n=1 Tax=Anguilla anguilla TaxID=7936 RepID=A0A0E9RAT4_ANGAN